MKQPPSPESEPLKIYWGDVLVEENQFNEDLSLKEFFHRIPRPALLLLINKLCGTTFSLDAKVTEESTEHRDSLGTLGKGSIRGDFAATILDGDEESQVIVEFQSTKPKDMAYRMFIYAFHMGKDNDSCPNQRQLPKSAVIFTNYSQKEEKQGNLEFELRLDKFKICGKEYPPNTPITVQFPYINTSVMEIGDFQSPALQPLQVFHLLKYKRKPTLLNDPEALQAIELVHQYVAQQHESTQDFLYLELFNNLMVDIYSAASKQNTVNQEVLSMMNTTYGRTTSQIMMDEAELIGTQIGKEIGEKIGKEKGKEIGEKIGKEKGEKIGKEIGEKIGKEKGEKIGRVQERKRNIYDAYSRLGDKNLVCTAFACSLEELDTILSQVQDDSSL